MIAPISRGASSGHRVYDEDDLDQLMWIACLAATGMSVSDMRRYVANGQLGAGGRPTTQIELLAAAGSGGWRSRPSRSRCADATSQLKIDYWHAVEAGDAARADLLSGRGPRPGRRAQDAKRRNRTAPRPVRPRQLMPTGHVDRACSRPQANTTTRRKTITMRVNAYAAPAAGQPLAPTTIERRDVGAQRRPHRDPVRRHLPLRHPHRQRRLGPAALPRRARATRSSASSPRSAPTSPATRSATGSASAAWSTPAASAPTAATATSSTA